MGFERILPRPKSAVEGSVRGAYPVRRKQASEARGPRVGEWPVARRDLPYRLRIWIPSTNPALNRAVAQVGRLVVRCGCSEDRQADLEIALREALANAMMHGNARRPGRKVFLRCSAGPRAGILIAVRDEGQGFDPDSVPDPTSASRKHLPHGRGLLLMRELTDCIVFRRGGSEVVLFRRTT